MPVLLDLSRALLTPIIAILAVWIAYQQLETNRRKLELELYDRRLRIYGVTRAFIGTIISRAKLEQGEPLTFIREVSEAKFLFDADVTDLIDKLWKKSIELESATFQLQDGQLSALTIEERKQINGEKWDAIRNVGELSSEVDKIFSRYLSLFSKKRNRISHK